MEVLKAATDQFAEVASSFGAGYGSGAGYDHGSGFSDNPGDSFGRSPGYGCSPGYGTSSGCGYGHGSGVGYGYDSGYGCGCGYDSGVVSFCGQKVYQIDNVPTLIDYIHGNVAKGQILQDDFTTGDCYIVKHGSIFAHGKTLHKAMDALRDKLFADMPEEERIAEFIKAHDWGKQYSSADYYEWHHRLTGSCDMGRSEFAKCHGYKLTDDELLTVDEFIKLTENSYGGSVIRKLREAYGEEAT